MLPRSGKAVGQAFPVRSVWNGPCGSNRAWGTAARYGSGRAAGGFAFELEQAEGGEFVGDQDVEEAAAQRAEDRLDLVQAAGHADHLGDLGQVRQLDADPAVVNGQPDDGTRGVEELPQDVPDYVVVAQLTDVESLQVAHLHDGGVRGGRADSDDRLFHAAGLLQYLLDRGFGLQRRGQLRGGRHDRGGDDRRAGHLALGG